MRLNELLEQYGLQNLENLSPGSFTDLLDTYCRELNGSAGNAIDVLEEQEELPKAIVVCIRKATSLLLDSSHNLAVCPSFCKFCSLLFTLLSELSSKKLLSQYSMLLLQSLAKIAHSLSSSSSFSSPFLLHPHLDVHFTPRTRILQAFLRPVHSLSVSFLWGQSWPQLPYFLTPTGQTDELLITYSF